MQRRLFVPALVLFALAAAPADAALTWKGHYRVNPGDSLTEIATDYGVSLAALAHANGLSPSSTLVIGAVLRVPAPPAASAPAWHGRYTVQVGDSLGAIASDYGTSIATLAAANTLNPNKPLLVGTILTVPTPPKPKPPAWPGRYVVVSGDTLSSIALRYGVSLDALAVANHLDASAVLPLGARLAVPAQAATIDLAQLAESDPYAAGAIGYDVSYPGCAGIPPADDAFALIGLNAGRPFTPNPCFSREWAAATGPRSVYINTAFSPTLERHVTADCAAAGAGQRLAAAAQRAYAIGCSEADAAIAQLGGTAPLAIWLDVEPANTWSAQPVLNDAALSGILEQLLAHEPHTLVGVYSKAVFWVKITGNWNAPDVPEWIATGAAGASTCGGAFAGGPVWLSQQANGLLDFDTAC